MVKTHFKPLSRSAKANFYPIFEALAIFGVPPFHLKVDLLLLFDSFPFFFTPFLHDGRRRHLKS